MSLPMCCCGERFWTSLIRACKRAGSHRIPRAPIVHGQTVRDRRFHSGAAGFACVSTISAILTVAPRAFPENGGGPLGIPVRSHALRYRPLEIQRSEMSTLGGHVRLDVVPFTGTDMAPASEIAQFRLRIPQSGM